MLYSDDERILNGLLSASGARQNILANNLTNVRTKGYARQDLDFGMVLRDLKGGSKDFDKSIEKATFTEEGQKMTLEKELAQLGENHLKYLMLVRINGHIYKHMEEATQSSRAG